MKTTPERSFNTMANTFGILAAVALLIGAFVAHKNKGFLEDTIADTQSEESKKTTLTNKFNSLTSDITALDTESKQFNTFRDETQEKLDEQVAGNKKTQDSIDSKKGAADTDYGVDDAHTSGASSADAGMAVEMAASATADGSAITPDGAADKTQAAVHNGRKGRGKHGKNNGGQGKPESGYPAGGTPAEKDSALSLPWPV